jgi:predicted transcriptional regulator of viral defense system
MNIREYKAIDKWAGELDGVFTIADLKVILSDNSIASLYRKVSSFVEAGMLVKVKRGIYAVPDADLCTISSRIAPASYISTGTVLARKALIGSVPRKKVQAVKVGRPRTYKCEIGIIEHLSITPNLYFGFVPVNGILVANPEKAFLDVCYFRYMGRKFSFDPESDVNIESLNMNLICSYLGKYDKRFVSFFNRIWRS